jgi:GTPase
MSHNMIDLEVPPVTETAVLVRLVLPEDSDDQVEESLNEMRQLAWTAGAEIACVLLQRRPKPCPNTLIGTGKVQTLLDACQEYEADLVIFDSDLSPRQGANLRDALGVKVVDRTQLILDIFAQRARTIEGKLQVELAQLDYQLPRLTGRGAALMRQQGGIGVRGPGEQKLEVDRRVTRNRIGLLKRELENVRRRRREQRKKRQKSTALTAALVGYTNAGKSSLLNAVAQAGVFVENKLFATLDPTSRRCVLPSGRTLVLTDTVGFIRNLPHPLIAAFRATLEEVTEADLLIIVADAAHPAVEEHLKAVKQVLDELDVHDKPVLRAFNKIDIADPQVVRKLAAPKETCLPVSARTGEGLSGLMNAIDAQLASRRRRVHLRFSQDKAGLAAKVYENGHVFSQTYDGNDILVEAEIEPALLGAMREYMR